jgi:hypothetical protein
MVAAEDPEHFFAASPPLRDAAVVAASLQEFVARNSHASSGSRGAALHGGQRADRAWAISSNEPLTARSSLTRAAFFVFCFLRCARRRRRAAAHRLRHVGRDHGAAGAAMRALHRQLQLRPPRRRVHRVSFLLSCAPPLFGCSLVRRGDDCLSHTLFYITHAFFSFFFSSI